MSTPLRLLLLDLLDDPAARSAFDADPERFLADHGWEGLDGADVHAALGALTHELPLDQAARIAPLVADDAAFDGGGLSAAIAGLQAATAAVDDLTVANGAGGATALDDLAAADPAAGIDARSDGDPRIAGDPEPSDAEHDSEPEADEPAGIDDLRFGEAAGAPPADSVTPASTADEEIADDISDGLGGGDATPVEPFGADPATSFDDQSPRDFYDASEETSERDGIEEPDDGFPY